VRLPASSCAIWLDPRSPPIIVGDGIRARIATPPSEIVVMPRRINTDVLVVGGGPVGLSLAMDLARRGVGVVVAEMRDAGEPPSVRCNNVGSRTMEIFRRLGIAGMVRAAGLPADYPNDVAFRTTATGIEMARISIPCRAERYTAKGGPDTWWPTPEPPHRINQIYLEPVLFACARATPRVRILSRTRVLDFEQYDDGVRAVAKDLNSDATNEIFARYLIGCDGAHSEVRSRMGIRLNGDPAVIQVQSTYILAPDLLAMMPSRAWAIDCLNPRSWGLMFAIDGRERWLIHNFLPAIDRDRGIREILGVGPSFAFEVLGQEDWTGRRMIADRFRDRRIFLCGDAAHIWVPFAGYGMNAGIADAMDLSWMLAGVIKGWADPGLLDAYEIERQPITEQVSRYAMNTALERASHRSAIPDNIEQIGPEGDAVRARIGREAYEINVGQFCCGGLNFGYFYSASPIIAYDGEPAPAYDIYKFRQSTVPGCRTPHLWLRDGRSLYDVLGADFTLLRLDPKVEITGLVEAATHRGLPMSVIDVDADEAPTLYPHKLLISRPDQHVAWRGDKPPRNSLALVDQVRGVATGPYLPPGSFSRAMSRRVMKSPANGLTNTAEVPHIADRFAAGQRTGNECHNGSERGSFQCLEIRHLTSGATDRASASSA
jgi:2-polyprenyl-6-methoxyphenol hydroxylase-like FAD-dependent oxidoreductase